MTREPLFAIGETVILQSVLCPQYNGEYIVDRVLGAGEIFIDRVCGEESIASGEYGYYSYLLNEKHTELLYDTFVEIHWAEQALRKKHKPSEFGSFTNLMDNLKLPQKTPQEVK